MSKSPFRKIDPNVQAQREFAHRQFALQVQRGEAAILDRFGQKLEPGAIVLFHNNQDLVFQVAEVAPILDPNQPPGRFRLMLETTAPLAYPANVPIADLVRVGKQISEGHSEITGPSQEEPKAEPVEPSERDAVVDPSEPDPRD